MEKNKMGAMELLWLFLALISLVIAIHNTYLEGNFFNSWKYFVFVIICLLMFYIRKILRKRRDE